MSARAHGRHVARAVRAGRAGRAGRPARAGRAGGVVRAVRLLLAGAAVLALAVTTLVASTGTGTRAGAADVAPGAGAAPAPVRAADGDGLWSARRWLDAFAADWEATRPGATALATSGDSWDHYSLAYSVDALTAAYRAGGEQRYLDDALTLVEEVVASARPSSSLERSRYRDDHAGWASQREEVSGDEVPLYESYFWRYATHLLVVARTSGPAAADPAVQRRVDPLVSFAAREVFDKWFERGPDGTVFRERTHMSAHWAYVAMDLRDLTDDPVRRERCEDVVRAITGGGGGGRRSLAAQMVPADGASGALFWSEQWGSYRRPGQDVAHGNNVVAFVVEAHDRGAGWPTSTVRGLGATLDRVVWPRAGTGAAFVDGSGTGTGWFSDGWVKLGRYDPALQRRLQDHAVVNGQFMANAALNAAVLACRPGTGGPPACTPLPPWRQAGAGPAPDQP